MEVSGALRAIEELRVDAKIGKGKHFSASARNTSYHRTLGVPAIVINVFVAFMLAKGDPQGASESIKAGAEVLQHANAVATGLSGWVRTTTLLCVFSAAALAALQTFFNFQKVSEGHRAIGNRYARICRQCKALQLKQLDKPFTPEEIWKEYELLMSEYQQANIEAEAFPTNAKDLASARSEKPVSPFKSPNSLEPG